jgi:hypothetical protein
LPFFIEGRTTGYADALLLTGSGTDLSGPAQMGLNLLSRVDWMIFFVIIMYLPLI